MRSVRSTLQRLGWLSLGLVVGSPVLVGAQTVSKEQLVGTWQRVYVLNRRDAEHKPPQLQEEVITLRPDGTFDLANYLEGDTTSRPKENDPNAHWELKGDSLRLFWVNAPVQGGVLYRSNPQKAVLRDQQLLLEPFTWGEKQKLDPQELECLADRYQRIDPSKPRPAATLPSPMTIKRADLVGTWVVTTPSRAGAADTITLQADSTWTGKGSIVQPDRGKNAKRWDLLPGDRLQFGDYSQIIAFQGQQQFFLFTRDWDRCFRDGGDHLVFKRITP